MKVLGFCGYSGSGKTTLLEQLIPRLRHAGQRVSVVKHAHHRFDIDHPGKDSWRHRQAGAYEVVVASDRRLAKIREYEVEAEPTVHQLIAELSDCDWVLVEGFKHAADICKIEVWRPACGHPVQYPGNPSIVAVVTDAATALPQPPHCPVLALDDVDAVTAHLLQNAARYEYRPPSALVEPGRGPGEAARPGTPAR
ncbi:molybdopterin-guanine dinucleotide biosynthesis protein B [Caldimonas brevitalea]|uniref:Molybdopterin-guanine dinucleotide biosynthesis protein B n=1 Tax=Caldimonas brevitalea TaxID=413882 RepID=A0A0G3BM35_9BURK|nr:molybdopterin-guanine dinucleotide biosynthesis protein B [Caldimonas brevitalea]AKJ29053.1 molybdopterin-guanine dinucleotide biosynthesis protein B [Caldimonas brevitalea]